MNAHIFTEGSNTTADNRDRPVKEFYEGLFGIVAGLHDEISAFSDAQLHVLSEEYGVANGGDNLTTIYASDQSPIGVKGMIEQAKSELLTSAADADIMVILLSTDVFQATIGDVWDELVDAAKPGSIWCLGAARSALEELDFRKLEEKGCSVITYQRVGVARIGTETREQLLEAVEQRATQ